MYRRMRIARIEDLDKPLEDYFKSLEKTFGQYISKHREIKKALLSEENKNNKQLLKSKIVEIVNGTDNVPGLSELPEIPGYGELFDKIQDEYKALSTRKLSEEEKFSVGNETYNKLKNKCYGFLDWIRNTYSDKVYTSSWNPVILAILNIVWIVSILILLLLLLRVFVHILSIII